jgi:hypothetical protein
MTSLLVSRQSALGMAWRKRRAEIVDREAFQGEVHLGG